MLHERRHLTLSVTVRLEPIVTFELMALACNQLGPLRMHYGSILVSISALTTLQAEDAIPLPPNGKWIVEEKLDRCEASRTFGSEEVSFKITSRPNSPYLLTFQFARPVNVTYGEKIGVRLGDNAQEMHLPSMIYSQSGRGMPSAVTIKVDNEFFERNDITTIKISSKREVLSHLLLPHITTLISSLKTCSTGLFSRFGIDPATQTEIAISPKALTEFRPGVSNIYPRDAFIAGAQGTAYGRIHITADGVVSDCVIVISSGNSSLDKASCEQATKATKFRPALDKNGQPVASDQIFTQRWVIPAD